MTKLLCVDLCSGLGGFSEAFINRGHDVIRIDNNRRFRTVPNTIIGNVRDLPLEQDLEPDILLMSPPCNRFSLASAKLHWKKGKPANWGTVESLRRVFWCIDAVDYLKPHYWVMENPTGMLRKVIGEPNIKTYWASWGEKLLKPTDLWGNIPPGIEWKVPDRWENWNDVRGKSAEIRAKIPYKLSEALCLAVEKARL